MSKLAMIFLTTVALATAQSPDFRVFRAVLTPANQQGGDNGGGASRSSGTATLRVFAARDTGGSVSAGTADLTIDFNLGSGTTVRAIQIRNAAAGQTGPVGINSNITEQNAVTIAAQSSISRQIPVLAGDPIGIGTLSRS